MGDVPGLVGNSNKYLVVYVPHATKFILNIPNKTVVQLRHFVLQLLAHPVLLRHSQSFYSAYTTGLYISLTPSQLVRQRERERERERERKQRVGVEENKERTEMKL